MIPESLTKLFLVILVLSLFSGAGAETHILNTTSSNPTLNIPRWKMFANASDPNELWLVIADNHDQIFKSLDGGATWTAFSDTAANTYDTEHGGQVHGWVDYHASLTGNGRDLWISYPDGTRIYWQKISSPAASTARIGPEVEIATDGGRSKRSNVVATDDEIFVFTRTSNYAGGNLRYFRYGHDGSPKGSGFVANLSDTNIRIGSTLDASGRPVVVAWCDGARIEYYRWNGSSFTQPEDSLVWDSDDGNNCDSSALTREFAFSVTEDNTLHVIWSCTGERVQHAHKRMGEAGAWTYIPVFDHPEQNSYGFRAATTHRGTDLWVFAALDRNNSATQSDIWYRKWSGANSTWGPAVQLTFDHNNNRQPNPVWKVPAGANSIPFMYWKGANSVYTERIALGGAGKVPNGEGVGEQGLSVSKATGSDLDLVWDASCLAGDSDYSIYQGSLSGIYSHQPKTCTTFGLTHDRITPGSGSLYFLVVPQGGSREGSYGQASDGGERPPSSSPCRSQEFSGCP